MKRDFLFVCNFKMNIVSAQSYADAMKDEKFENVILCPNNCYLQQFKKLKETNAIKLGAQNVSEFEKGSYTGETSSQMLKEFGVDCCIVGHSERKKNNFETLSQTNSKILALQKCDIIPIVCVGEDTKKDAEFASRFVLAELNEVLKDADMSRVIVAYEPVWSIGTGLVPEVAYIKSVVDAIKKYTGIPVVLYGGSFNLKNYLEIADIDCVDGALIGGASLHPCDIVKMQKSLKE